MTHPLEQRLGSLKQRMLAIGACGGLLWALAGSALLLMLWMWVDLLLDLSPYARIAGGLLSAVAAVVIVIVGVVLAHRTCQRPHLARRLDFAAEGRGQVVAGADLLLVPSNAELTEGLRTIAVSRATALAGGAPLGRAAPLSPLKRAVGVTGAVAAALLIAIFTAPRIARTEWQRFTDPFGETPAYTRLTFKVEPGDATVPFGSGLDVKATVAGGAVDRLDVVQVLPTGEDVVPMFADAAGTWHTPLSNLTSARSYYVRARGGRSASFKINVLTVPKIEAITFYIQAPPYTRAKPYGDGPLPPGGLGGLPGTEVRITARSNRPLSGGTLTLAMGETRQDIDLKLSGTMEVRGTFKITGPGKLALTVRDTEGQACQEPFSTSIALFSDERPFVRILEPRQESFATPDAALPVEIVAEDDFGVSSLELYRSLNESRALPQELKVPAPPSGKLSTPVRLDLAKLGLRPGDAIRFYARVEDNDPEGAKGSESNVVTVRIISQEEYLRMALAQDGLEVLLSKYNAAARRMEAIESQLRKQKEDLAKLDGSKELTDEDRKRLGQTADEANDAAKETAKSAEKPLPFDIDQAFNERLKEIAKRLDEVGKGAGDVAKKQPENNAEAVAALDKLINGLKADEEAFAKDITEPLDYLAKLIPLLLDQEAFVQIYEHQKDLVARLSAVKDKKVGDDPKLKAKMRDWELEQRRIRDDLVALTEDIKTHAAQLPDDPDIDEFRKSAEEFVEKLKELAPDEHMVYAESALAEFWGEKAHEEAKKALDILDSLISKCEAMGGNFEGNLKFKPNLSKLGNTIAQLKGAGRGGSGMGRGGYSTGQQVGVYGRNPFGQPGKKKGGQGRSGPTVAATGSANPKDGAQVKVPGHDAAAGAGSVPLPAQYRKRASDYLQRVADELQPE